VPTSAAERSYSAQAALRFLGASAYFGPGGVGHRTDNLEPDA